MYNRRLVQGVGVNDSPILTTLEDGTRDPSYMKWKGILNRVYSKKALIQQPCYFNSTVSEDFLIFSKFKDWHVNQVGYGEVGYDVDKDLLVKGNSVYSPSTCVLLPKEINLFMIKRISSGCAINPLPIGVYYHKTNKKYRSQINDNGKRKSLGYFKTPEEAFYAYKEAKEQQAKSLANKWKGKIDERAYEALLNYTVDIED